MKNKAILVKFCNFLNVFWFTNGRRNFGPLAILSCPAAVHILLGGWMRDSRSSKKKMLAVILCATLFDLFYIYFLYSTKNFHMHSCIFQQCKKWNILIPPRIKPEITQFTSANWQWGSESIFITSAEVEALQKPL